MPNEADIDGLQPDAILIPKSPTLDQLLEAAWDAWTDEQIFGSYVLEFEDPEDAKRYVELVKAKAETLRR